MGFKPLATNQKHQTYFVCFLFCFFKGPPGFLPFKLMNFKSFGGPVNNLFCSTLHGFGFKPFMELLRVLILEGHMFVLSYTNTEDGLIINSGGSKTPQRNVTALHFSSRAILMPVHIVTCWSAESTVWREISYCLSSLVNQCRTGQK